MTERTTEPRLVTEFSPAARRLRSTPPLSDPGGGATEQGILMPCSNQIGVFGLLTE